MDTVVVFTSKDIDTIFAEGGSGDWVANKDRLAKCTYIVAVANAHSNWSKHPQEKHAHAFIIGKITGIFESASNPGRVVIQFDEYASIDTPNAWSGQRNPVRYTDLSELGIDPGALDWQPFPADKIKEIDATKPLTIEEAKLGLAKKLGVTPDCIEITIQA
ncbi:MAG TPA: hypothetical protein ENJ84_05385 [Gammaproteobacteria bacterium]|nr:hypothetical protein [Gammaproteobacteria bacterium]